MKTISQYREDIKLLMDKVQAVKDKCTSENRDPVPEEVSYMKDLHGDIKELTNIVATLDEHERLRTSLEKPEAAVTHETKRPALSVQIKDKEKFSSFGEQMFAVMRAGQPGGHADPRLFNAAASGLNESITSDGGFLVQQDFSTELIQQVFETGILASKCRRMPISGVANGMKINGVDETSRASTRWGGILGYWEEEAAEKTATKPKFRKIELNLKKLIGLCYATDELLQDAAALGGYIQQGFISEFGFLLDDAIINGTGAGQPLGILNAGCLVSVAKETGQKAATIMAENVVNMYSRMFASSRPNAVWLINQNIEPQLFTMSLAVGTGGIPIYMPAGGLSGQPYGTLFGRPVIAIEQAATLGTVGDIIFADLSGGYILAEKGGIQSDMSIHVRFVYDESVFRFVMRVDGQPVRATALTPYKGGANYTQSHFIALATRS
ncbi:MAG: phage major capsid protein [Sphaerochaeta sp.]|jgi:HK97 family phage major capsid protein|nr:phage major capsid protein [Sphaerochaeta sp.]